jgi:hypothetical protein
MMERGGDETAVALESTPTTAAVRRVEGAKRCLGQLIDVEDRLELARTVEMTCVAAKSCELRKGLDYHCEEIIARANATSRSPMATALDQVGLFFPPPVVQLPTSKAQQNL